MRENSEMDKEKGVGRGMLVARDLQRVGGNGEGRKHRRRCVAEWRKRRIRTVGKIRVKGKVKERKEREREDEGKRTPLRKAL